MELLSNPHRGTGLPATARLAQGRVAADATRPLALIRHCPRAAATPLRELPALAAMLGVSAVHLKDECHRMGLGSFKALGAAYAIAHDAARSLDGSGIAPAGDCFGDALDGSVYACASAGNHGLSVAAGARLFGARAVIYLADAVPEAFAERLRALGAEVRRPGGDYAACMEAAAIEAEASDWTLLSDSSWEGYVDLPATIMEGYLVMAEEITRALTTPPTHVFLQAGVGCLAAAMTAHFRMCWGDAPTIVVVEPEVAPALMESIRAGTPVATSGPVSRMGRLDCKEPSHLALGELARGADGFVTVSEQQADEAVELLAAHGIETTPSGAAGVAAVQHAGTLRDEIGLSATSRVLVFASEGREDQA